MIFCNGSPFPCGEGGAALRLASASWRSVEATRGVGGEGDGSSQDPRQLQQAPPLHNRRQRAQRAGRQSSPVPPWRWTRSIPRSRGARRDTWSEAYPHCCEALSEQDQKPVAVHDRIEIPPVKPKLTRVHRHGGCCPRCRKRFVAEAPSGLEPESPFGCRIEALVITLRFVHAISFDRLRALLRDLFALTIREGSPCCGRRFSYHPRTDPRAPQHLLHRSPQHLPKMVPDPTCLVPRSSGLGFE